MVFYRLGEGWDGRGRKIFGLVTITQSPYKVLKYSDDPLQLRSIFNLFFYSASYKICGSIPVSGQLPTDPSPNLLLVIN